MRIYFLLLVIFWGVSKLSAQTGLNDLNFNSNDPGYGNCDGPNAPINAIATTNSGKVIVGGLFTTFNTKVISNLTRLNQDGSIDSTFQIGTGVNGQIKAIKILSNQQILIAGSFTAINGVTRNQIARLNEDGTVDLTFEAGSGFNGTIEDIAIQNDQKVIVVGDFTNINGVSKNRIVRLNTNGIIDNTFSIGTGADNSIMSVVIQNDNKIIIGGGFGSYNGVLKETVARINSDGSLDTSFSVGNGANNFVQCVNIQADGKILVGGPFSNFHATARNGITRLNADGSNDLSFNPGTGVAGIDFVFQIKQLSDGRILFAGEFSSYNGILRRGIAVCDSIGNLDASFDANISGLNNNVLSFEIQSNGSIIICGNLSRISGVEKRNIAKIYSNGTLDSSFMVNYGANGMVNEILKSSNNELLIAGAFTMYNNVYSPRIALIHLDGSIDSIFSAGEGPNNSVRTICRQPDNKILIGGIFDSVNQIANKYLARLNSNGSLDNTFYVGSGLNDEPVAIQVQNDGKILVGGYFTTYDNNSVNRIVRLNTDGTIDPTFNSGTGFNGVVLAIALQGDGKIIVGGDFTSYNSTSINRIIRLNVNGSIDPTFSVTNGANYDIAAIIIQPDGKIVVGGNFTSIGGFSIPHVARLNINGQVESTFNSNPGVNGYVYSLALQDDGKIVVGGSFNQIFTENTNVMRLNINGTNDPNFVNYDGPSGIVNTVEVGSNGKIFAGGNFTSYNGIGRNRITSIYSCVIDTIQIISACDSLIWIDGNTYYSSTNTPTWILPNSNGCDTLITLHLTILNNVGVDIQTACDSLTWIDGNTYYASTNLPTFVLQNAAGCDSTVTLNLTIMNSNTGTDVQTACDSYTWIDGNTYYSSTNTPTFVLQNATSCDSIVTLNLTIIPSLPLIIENVFSMPSDANSCIGEAAIDLSGNAPFELDLDNGSQVITSNGYSLITNLCPGIHDLHVTDNCGDTLSNTVVIPVDSNYVFNNPFIDSLAQDSLGVTLTNCDIYYAGIDTAYIDSIWANGNTVNVIWNIVDSNGSNFDTTSYVLNNGNGVYWLQLSVFCPNKSTGEYFTVTEAIYFNNGSVSTAGLQDIGKDLFAIYPNPTNDQVHISFSGSDAELTIYDAQGKLVLKDHIQNNGIVSLENFERGVYLFDFNNSNGRSVQRVIKQ